MTTKGHILSQRPPIVAVLGHVDHGKTTLLDNIRKTSVVEKEHGGITQHIGAYQMEVKTPSLVKASSDKQKPKVKSEGSRLITFIDTPGHEAFIAMRSRGATVSDIALLVVAADDSVKPQTKESIDIIKKSGVPMIVVVNKIDLPTANVDTVKKDLARNGVQVEGFGGDVPIVTLSAKKNTGIDALLSTIISYNEKHPLPNERDADVEAVVIETKVDKGKGLVATLITKKGVIKRGTSLFENGKEVCRVRAMFDEHGAALSELPPGKPGEILGFFSLPEIGAVLLEKESVPEVVDQKSDHKEPKLPDFLSDTPDEKTLNIIIKADTAGSLEAIVSSFGSKVTVVSSGVGDIGEADILLAKSTHAFVIGFNVRCRSDAEKLAQVEGVVLRNYKIIYKLLDEIGEAVEGISEVITKDRELGKGTVIAEFPYDGKRVAGVKISSGRLAKGDFAKIMRNEEEIGRARIKSLKKGKDDVTKLDEEEECGVLFDKDIDFALDDAIIAYIRS